MTIHVIIPVFNRLAMTQSLVECLRAQTTKEPLNIVVVNDGSTDGTKTWLSAQNDITVLEGDGSLFWGGAVDLAIRFIISNSPADDWVLMMNNDTIVDIDFVQKLVDAAQSYAPAAVGCLIRDLHDTSRVLSVGARIDAERLLTSDIADDPVSESTIMSVDALSGRGALFPLSSLIAVGGMRPKWLPHYLADYELSLRVQKAGWKLLIVTAAFVQSEDDYGSQRRFISFLDRLFSIRSPNYVPALLAFWWQASTWPQRFTLPARVLLMALSPKLRKSRI